LAIFGALELVALVFWMLAVDVYHKPETWIRFSIFLSLAGSSFLLGGTHLLSEAAKTSRQRRGIWSFSAVVCVIFSLVVFVSARPLIEPRPHLRLLLNTPRFPSLNLALTNELLFLNPKQTNELGVKVIKPSDLRALLVVPIEPAKTDNTLRFEVVNDSSVVVEDGQFITTITEVLGASLSLLQDTKWVPFLEEPDRAKRAGYRLPRIMYSGDQERVPDIIFDGITNRANKVSAQVLFRIRAKEMQDMVVGFWLAVELDSTNQLPKLLLLPDSNQLISNRFRFRIDERKLGH
jgi:hypothetical protein